MITIDVVRDCSLCCYLLWEMCDEIWSGGKSMRSPFPGMDPYTEARHLWKGLHTQLIGELSTHQLPPLLAPAYFVDAEPSLQVLSGRDVYPDVQIVQEHKSSQLQPAGLGLPVAEATAAIAAVPAVEEEDESAIFIREASTEHLVTVIEILSYSNKTGGAEKRARYLLKRRELCSMGVHMVEVDLLRWGQRVVSTLPEQPYHILVSRADEQPLSRVWSFGLAARFSRSCAATATRRICSLTAARGVYNHLCCAPLSTATGLSGGACGTIDGGPAHVYRKTSGKRRFLDTEVMPTGMGGHTVFLTCAGCHEMPREVQATGLPRNSQDGRTPRGQ